MEELSFSDLPGKTILAGITYYTKDREILEQKQYWGTVIEANDKWIRFRQKNGDIFALPPDLSSTKAAAKGEYRLLSTGEIVVDPDFTSVWSVYAEEEAE